MNNTSSGKITKSQFISVKQNSRSQYPSSSGYDLNENGGFVADRRIMKSSS